MSHLKDATPCVRLFIFNYCFQTETPSQNFETPPLRAEVPPLRPEIGKK